MPAASPRSTATTGEALEDVVDGLFAIAKADGAVHEAEFAYLQSVAAIFGIDGADFERIAARHVVTGGGRPLPHPRRRPVVVACRDPARATVKLVAENHPDRLIARGLPEEFVAIATGRMAAINRAFERIELERRRRPSN